MWRSSIWLVACVILAACGPSGQQGAGEETSPERTTPPPGGIQAPPEGSGAGDTGLTWTVPAGWVEESPENPVRRAQYRVGPEGRGECVVYYFGPGQGGEPMANALRWAGQFVQPDGSDSRNALETESLEVGGMQVLWIEVTGTYQGGMPMAPQEPQPGCMLLGAVAEGPDASWFFKFTGPESLLRDQEDEFRSLVESLEAGA